MLFMRKIEALAVIAAFTIFILPAATSARPASAKSSKTSMQSDRTTNVAVDVKILPEDEAVRNAVLNIDSMLPPRPDQVRRLATTWRGIGGDTTMKELREEAITYIRSLSFEPNDTLVGAVMSLRLDQPQLAAYEASGQLSRSDTTGEYFAMPGTAASDDEDEEGDGIFVALLVEKVNRARSLIEAEIRRQYRMKTANTKSEAE